MSVSVDSLQCSLAALQGTVTAPVSFTTLPAPPDQPRPPTLQNKTKTSLHVRYGEGARPTPYPFVLPRAIWGLLGLGLVHAEIFVTTLSVLAAVMYV